MINLWPDSSDTRRVPMREKCWCQHESTQTIKMHDTHTQCARLESSVTLSQYPNKGSNRSQIKQPFIQKLLFK